MMNSTQLQTKVELQISHFFRYVSVQVSLNTPQLISQINLLHLVAKKTRKMLNPR